MWLYNYRETDSHISNQYDQFDGSQNHAVKLKGKNTLAQSLIGLSNDLIKQLGLLICEKLKGIPF